MPVEYFDFEEARQRRGLRMVVVPGVPSPWGEAAKGILCVKEIPYAAVKLDQGNAAMAEWTGERGGPVAMWDDDPPRSGWAEILLLAERLAPKPALLPADPTDRALAFGLSHELCGENGLGWVRRLQGVSAGLKGDSGFPPLVAAYLGDKYGYREEEAPGYTPRVVELLEMFAARLHAQKNLGSHFYIGQTISAVDIYGAAFTALLKPLPAKHCPMSDGMRAGFESMDDETAAALDPIFLEHRDFIYKAFLELPLSI